MSLNPSRASFRAPLLLNRQAGMSLVELLVGVAIGLFIVAAATLMVGNQLSDNRRLLLETQLQQDMRASMDIMVRQIRRAGLWEDNDSLSMLATDAGQPGQFVAARYDIQVGAGGDEISFNYWLNFQDRGAWGFRLRNGAIQTSLSRGGWQDLTDRNTVNVTALRFTPVASTSEVVPCPNLCPDTTTACWPRSMVRAYRITLQAQAASDPQVTRQMQALARVRNNLPVFNANSETQPCPP